jgi:hypothetical protein
VNFHKRPFIESRYGKLLHYKQKRQEVKRKIGTKPGKRMAERKGELKMEEEEEGRGKGTCPERQRNKPARQDLAGNLCGGRRLPKQGSG